ncbi:MAG: hypothetical protein OK452_01405 [Thaumarchaeota archaeon]|nr:hypothetical protein [Nitrososphaerota archaeon]
MSKTGKTGHRTRDEILDELDELMDTLRQEHAVSDSVSAGINYQSRAYALSSELFLGLQETVADLTRSLIRWNRILALSTTVLAGMAVVSILINLHILVH